MPAQTTGSGVAYYSVGDTAPALSRQLLDGNGDAIDLSTATVTITIAHARHSYYYSPAEKIADQLSVTVDPDQTNNTGWVHWWPPVGVLDPAGTYQFNFEITYSGGRVQTIPPNTYLPLVIRSKAGGLE